jgi:hypothetical protein
MTTLNFSAAVDKWVGATNERMTAVFRESSQRTVEDMDENTPFDIGFLLSSRQVVVNGQMPIANRSRPEGVQSFTPPAYSMIIASAKIGDSIVIGYTAVYGPALEFGTDTIAPRGWVRGAAQRWPATVRAVANLVRSRSQTR